MMYRSSLSSTYCMDDNCPPFYSEIYVKVVDWSKSSTFSIPGDVWSKFCPRGCEGSSFCFSNGLACLGDDFEPPCSMSPHEITFIEVPCSN
eukprot:Trichotokara_eunicae@DN7645_c0_g1_i1.p1